MWPKWLAAASLVSERGAERVETGESVKTTHPLTTSDGPGYPPVTSHSRSTHVKTEASPSGHRSRQLIPGGTGRNAYYGCCPFRSQHRRGDHTTPVAQKFHQYAIRQYPVRLSALRGVGNLGSSCSPAAVEMSLLALRW